MTAKLNREQAQSDMFMLIMMHVLLSGEGRGQDAVRPGVQAAEPPRDGLLRARVHGHPGSHGQFNCYLDARANHGGM